MRLGATTVAVWTAQACKAAAAALALAIAGCGAPGMRSGAPPAWLDDEVFAAERFDPDAAQILAVSPAMRRYLEQSIVPRLRGGDPALGLVDALYTSGELRIVYDDRVTRTAAQTFDARRGDCLSLALMTAAFARELGLEVRLQRVLTRDVAVDDGDLVRMVGHVNVSVAAPAEDRFRTWTTVDFLPSEDAGRLRFEALTTRRIEAMYLNNKAAEALSVGQLGAAYWWARASAARDPWYAGVLITLGVVWDRAGRSALARQAYAGALDLDPGNPNATRNLGLVGKTLRVAAEPTGVAGVRRRVVGLLKAGDYELARRELMAALERADDTDLHLLLAAAWTGLAQPDRAADALAAAARGAPGEVSGRAALQRKIAALRAAGTAP